MVERGRWPATTRGDPQAVARAKRERRDRARLHGVHVLAAEIGGLMNSKSRVKGLRLVATDIDHAVGDGPEVRGSAEAILLVASGRTVALPELTGDGVPILTARIAA